METKDGFSESAKSRLRKIAEEPKTKLVDWMAQGKHLHEKQIAIAKRSGRPVPKYLEQQLERRMG